MTKSNLFSVLPMAKSPGLPRLLREEIKPRLHDGQPAKEIIVWLNPARFPKPVRGDPQPFGHPPGRPLCSRLPGVSQLRDRRESMAIFARPVRNSAIRNFAFFTLICAKCGVCSPHEEESFHLHCGALCRFGLCLGYKSSKE